MRVETVLNELSGVEGISDLQRLEVESAKKMTLSLKQYDFGMWEELKKEFELGGSNNYRKKLENLEHSFKTKESFLKKRENEMNNLLSTLKSTLQLDGEEDISDIRSSIDLMKKDRFTIKSLEERLENQNTHIRDLKDKLIEDRSSVELSKHKDVLEAE